MKKTSRCIDFNRFYDDNNIYYLYLRSIIKDRERKIIPPHLEI